MRVFFTHLGCKLNQAEVESLARAFLAAGHRVVPELEEADLHVVNTCTVTHVADRTSRKAAGRARRSGRPLRTVVTGCWAAAEPDAAARLPGVDLVVGNAGKERLVERVHEAFPDAVPERAPELPDLPVPYVPLECGSTRALLKVEDGCDMRCAFCIIPATRGRQRSRPLPEVVAEARSLAAAGFREIVVTGVQISAYLWEGLRLPDLVAALLRDSAAPRLRLTSIAPWDFDDRLLPLFGDPRLCRHFHFSLQSGAAATLRRMRRPYTAAGYAALLERVRAAVPGAAVTTDVIAGFPGETGAEFAESLAFVRAMGFAKVHAFPYSARPGTAAAAMPGQVPAAEKKERTARLLAVAGEAERRFWQAQVGRRAAVLWERPKGGTGRGLTGDYVRVLCPEARNLAGRIAEAELVGVAEGGVLGTVVRAAQTPGGAGAGAPTASTTW